MRIRRGPVTALAACLVVGLLVGCSASGGESDAPNPYRGDFELALASATSDFERQVLADLVISRAEYEEAVARYVECANDGGVELEAVPQGDYYVYRHAGMGSSDIDEVLDGCSQGTVALIEGLYIATVTNPNREGIDELRVACLKRQGLVDDAYTVDEYVAARSASPPAFPFDPEDPRARECRINPSG
jgi:hypothetical protein